MFVCLGLRLLHSGARSIVLRSLPRGDHRSDRLVPAASGIASPAPRAHVSRFYRVQFRAVSLSFGFCESEFSGKRRDVREGKWSGMAWRWLWPRTVLFVDPDRVRE
jgi:hypothetical protein